MQFLQHGQAAGGGGAGGRVGGCRAAGEWPEQAHATAETCGACLPTVSVGWGRGLGKVRKVSNIQNKRSRSKSLWQNLITITQDKGNLDRILSELLPRRPSVQSSHSFWAQSI